MWRLRRVLSRACRPDGPPLASTVLMLLLCCLRMLDGCELLGLEPGLILQHFQVHRLFTYPVCPPDLSLLLLDLLVFILLGWRQERELGTLRYLQRAALCTTTSGLLYLVLARLFTQAPGVVCGYTTVHLALLSAEPFTRWKGVLWWVTALTLYWGLLLLTSLSYSSFPLYMCGSITGLVYAAGALSWLELTKQKLEDLESLALCRMLARNPCLHFVPTSRTAGTLPHIDPVARDRLSRPLDPHRPPQVLPAGYLQSSSGTHEPPRDGHNPAGSWVQQSFIQGGEHPQNHAHAFPPWLPPAWHPDVPLTVLESSLVEEEMLQAGIQASFQQFKQGSAELKLPKSSVSALRLQQLERMGFSTQQAVVALAATGKVEGAVSLLVGGQVGEETLVMTDGGLRHPGRPGELQHSARLQDPPHRSGE